MCIFIYPQVVILPPFFQPNQLVACQAVALPRELTAPAEVGLTRVFRVLFVPAVDALTECHKEP